MTKKIISRVALGMLLCVQSVAYADFSHPGALHSAEELGFLKSAKQIQDGSWADFNAKAEAAYNKPLPTPVAEFKCGRVLRGQGTHPACKSIILDSQRAYTLALQWYLSGEQKYGRRSLAIIRLWQNEFCAIRGNLIEAARGEGSDVKCKGGTYDDDRGQSGLQASWVAPHFVNAAEILRHADPQRSLWTTADTRQFNTFLNRLWNEMDEKTDGASYSNAVWTEIEAKMAIAIFQDNKAKFDDAVDLWKQRIKASIYMRTDGPQPKHVPKRTGRAFVQDWNFPTGFDSAQMADGVQAETCRDLNHADMAFRAQTYSAHMAFNQGVDLFEGHKSRILAFMELHNGMRNGAMVSDICKNPSIYNKANRVLADAESRRRGTNYANRIKLNRERIKWRKQNLSVESGDSEQYRQALSELVGTGSQNKWVELLTLPVHENDFDTHLQNLTTIANIAFWQEWPNRRLKCYGGSNSQSAYPCGNNGHDIDVWYLAFNHLSHRLGLDLPWTKVTMENYAANGMLVPSQQFIGLSKWESLGGLGTGLFSPSYNSWVDGVEGLSAPELELFRPPLNDDDFTGQDRSNQFVEPVQISSNTVNVSGNVISWPDDGWYQVQRIDDYQEVCAAGRSCQVPSGGYIVINHTTGQRFENVWVE